VPDSWIIERKKRRNEWCWKLLIRMTDFVSREMMLSIQPEVSKKKKNELTK